MCDLLPSLSASGNLRGVVYVAVQKLLLGFKVGAKGVALHFTAGF